MSEQSTVRDRFADVRGNRVEGDWEGDCIRGTLPNDASRINILNNVCVKTGTTGAFSAGIMIRRTNGTTQRSRRITIEHNKVSASTGLGEALEHGGIFISGAHQRVRISRNEIANVGPRGIYVHATADLEDSRITQNTLIAGTLDIQGTVDGPTTPNTMALSRILPLMVGQLS